MLTKRLLRLPSKDVYNIRIKYRCYDWSVADICAKWGLKREEVVSILTLEVRVATNEIPTYEAERWHKGKHARRSGKYLSRHSPFVSREDVLRIRQADRDGTLDETRLAQEIGISVTTLRAIVEYAYFKKILL